MAAERPLRVLTTAGALDKIAPALEAEKIGLDPVLVDIQEQVVWQDRRHAIADAAPEIAWFSPELFRRGLTDHFLALAATAPSLRWLQSARAGFNDPGLAALAQAGVRLTTSAGPAAALSEYVLAQALDHFQRGPERRAAQAEARWQSLPFREIGRTRWVIFGFGATGREIARRARVFGVHVTGVRRHGGSDSDADAVVTPEAAAGPMAEADMVVLCVPLSHATENMADARFFAGLKPGSLLLNIGRGGLLDENALRDALDAGRPGHAVLDVTRSEPLPPENWMWRHPAITITAHLSGLGDGMIARTRAVFIDNIRRFARGEALRNEVRAADVVASEGL